MLKHTLPSTLTPEINPSVFIEPERVALPNVSMHGVDDSAAETKLDRVPQLQEEVKVPVTPPEQWVDLYGDYLYGFAMSRLRNPDAAADCVQDTFFAGIKALDRFDGSRDIKFWLRGIMRNKIVDQIRKSVKENKVDIEAEDEALLESFWFKYSGIATTNPDPWQFNPRKYYDNSEFWVVFEKCINQVKDPARQAFVLRVLEDKTTEEVCKLMEITPNYLWVLLHRAREQLKRLLESKWTGADAK